MSNLSYTQSATVNWTERDIQMAGYKLYPQEDKIPRTTHFITTMIAQDLADSGRLSETKQNSQVGLPQHIKEMLTNY